MEIEGVRLRVLQYFLKNTPVGEHKEVLNDLKGIIGSEALHSEAVAEILLESLASHGTVVVHEGINLLLTSTGRTGAGFFDPKASATFDVDPYELSVSNFAQVTSGTTLSRLVQEKLDAYLTQNFSETAQARVFQSDESMFIFISCASVNLRNMWTGEWIGDWKVVEGKVQGKVSISSHYFEEGNLQLSQCKEFEKEIKGSSEESWAEEIVKAIMACDNLVQEGMNDVYDNLPQIAFKPMRRILPVTHVKFSEMYKTKMLT